MELNYKAYGNTGPAIVILHGLFGTLDNWHTVAVKLSKHFKVYTVDQRNHGHSPHSDEFDNELMANDLKDFITQHNLQKPNVIGHSMGGRAAMLVAANYPDIIDKLIVVDISPITYKENNNEVLQAMLDFPIASIQSRSEAEETMAKRIPDFAVRQLILKNLFRKKGGGYEWKINLSGIAKNYEKLTTVAITNHEIHTNTLFIRGGNSDYIQDKDISLINQIFPNNELVTIPGVGHWVHAEASEAFIEIVEGFLV